MKRIQFIAAMVLSTTAAIAQTTDNSGIATIKFSTLAIWVSIILIALVVILLYVNNKVNSAIKTAGLNADDDRNFWEKLLNLESIAKEKDLELDHEFDGIKELNNPIPFWFNLLFYGTVVAAFIYLMAYHVLNIGDLQHKEYETELVQAEISKQAYIKKAGNLIDENTVTELTDKAKLDKGMETFKAKCAVCHGDKGEGKVGPNLTDEYWLHGGDVKSVFKTIKYGVPSKGMVAWQNSLNGVQIQEVTSFILSLKGTNPPGAKEPQGEKM